MILYVIVDHAMARDIVAPPLNEACNHELFH